MGMKTKFTEEVADALAAAFRLGVSIEKAAYVAGINEDSVLIWRNKAKEGKQPYKDLFGRIERARAEGIQERLKRIEQAAKGGAVMEETINSTTQLYNPSTGVFENVKTKSRRRWNERPNWMADKWWLEHVEAKDFASVSRTELTGKDGEALPASNVVLFLPDNGRDAPQPDSATMNNAESI